MILLDDGRRKGGAPRLGAVAAGEPGPFGVRPGADDLDDAEPAPDAGEKDLR